MTKRKSLGLAKSLSDAEADQAMRPLFSTIQKINNQIKFHGSLHNKNLFLDKGNISLGEPLIVNDKAHKKMKDSRGTLDFFAPEFK